MSHVRRGGHRNALAMFVSTSREVELEVVPHKGWWLRFLAKVVQPLLR